MNPDCSHQHFMLICRSSSRTFGEYPICMAHKKDRNRAITIIKKLAQAVCSVKYLGQKNGAIKARTVWKGTIEGFSQFNTFKTYIDAQISKK